MPTKPVTSPPIWASNANWTVGPHAGQPTKVAPSAGEAQNGQVGGQTYKGQWSNYLGNLLSGWVTNWLALGSSAGAADAHIVETNALGATTLRAMTILGGAATTVGLFATGTTGAGPAQGVLGAGVGAAPGVSGLGGDGAMSGTGASRNGGAGVRGFSGTVDGTPGVLGIGSSVGSHDGVQGYGGAEGHGVYGETSWGGSAGVDGLGPSIGTRGRSAGIGVLGQSTDPDGDGVVGQTASGASTFADGVYGIGSGDGNAVRGRAASGYGVVAESDETAPERSAFRIRGQDAPPVTSQNGDIYFDDGDIGGLDRDELRVRRRAQWASVMLERRGYTRTFGVNASAVTVVGSGAPQTACTVTLAAPGEPRETGVVWLRITGEVGRSTAGAQDMTIRVLDDTAGVTIDTRTVELFQASPAYERDVSWLVPYTLPSPGTRQFSVEIESTLVATNVRIRDAAIQIYGVL